MWSTTLLFGQEFYQNIQIYLNTHVGKFLIISLCWTFSFHILNEIRHLFWDIGLGFDLKIAKLTGILTLIGSFVLSVAIFIIGRNII